MTIKIVKLRIFCVFDDVIWKLKAVFEKHLISVVLKKFVESYNFIFCQEPNRIGYSISTLPQLEQFLLFFYRRNVNTYPHQKGIFSRTASTSNCSARYQTKAKKQGVIDLSILSNKIFKKTVYWHHRVALLFTSSTFKRRSVMKDF